MQRLKLQNTKSFTIFTNSSWPMSFNSANKRARTEKGGTADGGDRFDSTKSLVAESTSTVTEIDCDVATQQQTKILADAESIEYINSDNNNDNVVLDPIRPNILLQAELFSKLFCAAQPFPHGIIQNFCKEGFLEEIIHELKHNSKVKFKETDLFRVYQSIDLGNMNEGHELTEKMPSLMKLKKAIYSPEYRTFVEKITGLQSGTLTDEVDCAANCHAKGCHLLCHDDVIGTRKVSFIIYLTDPEPRWTDEDGGRLELYEAISESGEKCVNSDVSQLVPDALPIKTILPEFNSMVYFAVQPGVSFHSVQEVFCDRPRLSIQGWYHTVTSPSNIGNATLQRLKSVDKGADTGGKYEMLTPSSSDGSTLICPGSDCTSKLNTLNKDDRLFLSKYINSSYLTDESMNEICKKFEEESSVQLRHFLVHDWRAKIIHACQEEDAKNNFGINRPSMDYFVGMSDMWKIVGPAHKQRFLEFTPKQGDENDSLIDAGKLMYHIRQEVFQSAAFGRWLAWISSLGFPLGLRGQIRRFRPGLDYTVAHYGVLTTNPVLDVTLCFCAGKGEQCTFDEETGELLGSDDDAIWESGDVGGFECYIAADETGEDQGPDAEYDDEDDTKLLSLSASNNSLSLVYRDPGTMRFVKYVGVGAPSSRWDIALEYELKSDETLSDESNEND